MSVGGTSRGMSDRGGFSVLYVSTSLLMNALSTYVCPNINAPSLQLVMISSTRSGRIGTPALKTTIASDALSSVQSVKVQHICQAIHLSSLVQASGCMLVAKDECITLEQAYCYWCIQKNVRNEQKFSAFLWNGWFCSGWGFWPVVSISRQFWRV